MRNLTLLWDNKADSAALSASSEDADFVAAFLQNIWPKLRAQTTGVSSEWWKWDLGAAHPVDYFILWNHNLTSGATAKIQGNDSDVWSSPSVDDSILWTPSKLFHKFSSTKTFRWWRSPLADSGNSAGYLAAGRAFLGTGFEFSYQYFKKAPRFMDPSQVDFSSYGQPSGTFKPPYRKFVYQFEGIPATDFEALWTIFQVVGKSKPFFTIEDPDNPLNTLYYVKAVSDWEFGPIVRGWFSLDLEVEEAR